MKHICLALLVAMLTAASYSETNSEGKAMEKAIFSAGCFWGVEAIFQETPGVIETTVGYTGGTTQNPTYKEVCSKMTGHAEAVEVVFDPSKVSYDELLQLFWRLHDPTTVNRQGPDRGPQYRSAVYYLTDRQKAAAEKGKVVAQKRWEKPIVTEIAAAATFYAAEDYHQDYFKKHGGHGCHYIRD